MLYTRQVLDKHLREMELGQQVLSKLRCLQAGIYQHITGASTPNKLLIFGINLHKTKDVIQDDELYEKLHLYKLEAKYNCKKQDVSMHLDFVYTEDIAYMSVDDLITWLDDCMAYYNIVYDSTNKETGGYTSSYIFYTRDIDISRCNLYTVYVLFNSLREQQDYFDWIVQEVFDTHKHDIIDSWHVLATKTDIRNMDGLHNKNIVIVDRPYLRSIDDMFTMIGENIASDNRVLIYLNNIFDEKMLMFFTLYSIYIRLLEGTKLAQDIHLVMDIGLVEYCVDIKFLRNRIEKFLNKPSYKNMFSLNTKKDDDLKQKDTLTTKDKERLNELYRIIDYVEKYGLDKWLEQLEQYHLYVHVDKDIIEFKEENN